MSFEDAVRNEYFEWLYDYVCKGRAHDGVSYRKLFMLLHSIEFKYSIRNDVNRAKDGISLRYRFALRRNNEIYADVLDGPCSVLEMIIALVIRCEETIMDDSKYGDRTGQWFWTILSNLDVAYMTDELFDRREAEDKIYRLLERRYDSDGKGGLFFIRNSRNDLRNVEIWTQLCWYLENFD